MIKSHGKISPDRFSAPVRNIFENDNLNDPFQIFAQLLRATPKLFFAAFGDFQAHLIPMYSKVHRPTAIFIDSVDEFFAHHLIEQKRHGLFGQLAEEFWYDAQFGLLLAIRQLFSHNPHIKTFAAIRLEAFNAKKGMLPDLANLTAHIFQIRWRGEELKSIFEQNIGFENPARLVSPSAGNELEKFFGAPNLRLRHPYTGKMEQIFEYIIRHTLRRPSAVSHSNWGYNLLSLTRASAVVNCQSALA